MATRADARPITEVHAPSRHVRFWPDVHWRERGSASTVNWRGVVLIGAGLAATLASGLAGSQAASPRYEYQASWIAVASPEQISAEVEGNSWARLVTFCPERGFTLQAPLLETGKRKPRLDAGAGSALSTASGTHRFQLCVLRTDDRNLWGDKTHDRGCLPDIVVKDGEFPRQLQIYGRTLTIAAPVEGKVPVSVTANPEDVPAAL